MPTSKPNLKCKQFCIAALAMSAISFIFFHASMLEIEEEANAVTCLIIAIALVFCAMLEPKMEEDKC